jgi:predicted Zn-dependent peptidase
MYKSSVLNNGITIVTEKIPQFRSISAGLWFKSGSMYETDEMGGISHFIEHMLFKGTITRSAKQIADVMDGIGGQLNAFTAKEYTCYYFKVLDEHLDTGLDLLSDMVLNSSFDPMEIEKEKGVILEEILMYEDSPEDVAYDLLSDAMFKVHPLSKPILGEQNTLQSFNRNKIMSFFQEYYSPQSVIVSVAGNFDDIQLQDLIQKYFGAWKPYQVNGKTIPEIAFDGNILFRQKDIEQTHICIGYPGIPLSDERIYSVMAFNNLFGGSMSSRLFQKIREDKGLVYSVLSHPSNYTIGGFFTIYASMKPSNAQEVLSIITEEIISLLQDGIASDELNKAKEQLKGNYILGLESTGSRMNAIGKSQLLLGKITPPEEVLDKISLITMDDVIESMEQIFSRGTAGISIIGKDDISSQVSDIMHVRRLNEVRNG